MLCFLVIANTLTLLQGGLYTKNYFSVEIVRQPGFVQECQEVGQYLPHDMAWRCNLNSTWDTSSSALMLFLD